MARDAPEGAGAGARETTPHSPVLDPITDLQYRVAYLRDLDWFMADAESRSLMGFAAARTADVLDGTWQVLRGVSNALLDGWTQLTTGLAKLWDLWIRPQFVRSHNLAVRLFNGIQAGPMVGLDGLRYLVNVWARPLLSWLSGQWTALRAWLQHMGALRGLALILGSAVDSLGVELETKALAGFELARSKVNESIVWLNHLVHPAGVLREDPWVWASAVYHADLVAVLVEGLIPEGLAAQLDALRAAWPGLKLSDLLAAFTSGARDQAAPMVSAVNRFRSGA